MFPKITKSLNNMEYQLGYLWLPGMYHQGVSLPLPLPTVYFASILVLDIIFAVKNTFKISQENYLQTESAQ
jgi:hypothetical protein